MIKKPTSAQTAFRIRRLAKNVRRATKVRKYLLTGQEEADVRLVVEKEDRERLVLRKVRSGYGDAKRLRKLEAIPRASRSANEPGSEPAAVAVSVEPAAYRPDARARAILRGVEIAEQDLREAGGAYDLAEVQRLLRGVTRQAIDKRVQEGSLLAVPGPSNRKVYPTLQFTRDGGIVPGLRAVRIALRAQSPWSVLNFLANPHEALEGRKPIDLLRSGDADLVVRAADGEGRQGS